MEPLTCPATDEEMVDAPDLQPFTEDEAAALFLQMQSFQRQYKEEGYKAPDDASPKEIELAMIRGTLNFRARDISTTLFYNFVAYPMPSHCLPASDPTTLLLREYQHTLTTTNEAWQRLIEKKLRRRHLEDQRRRREIRERHEMTSPAE
ncbi:hypothetical protein CkaCkLH20_05236 [Colletotrichum karsti]|uniref:Uncharacterized protein n=1 Tax=Colletotrichum karsti TaxID=1095194 RepID=A0A9P6IBM3_9PEZI|nr:uncharacterized protein CkaCkLH20_05236 [Colletotrichum karsti]KAF9877536.1 hypothetical protein CkaCkLH20_05236 [Colletotrichum karsti]